MPLTELLPSLPSPGKSAPVSILETNTRIWGRYGYIILILFFGALSVVNSCTLVQCGCRRWHHKRSTQAVKNSAPGGGAGKGYFGKRWRSR